MPDAGLVKEEFERVFALFGAQHKSFRRILYAVIVAGLGVFTLLVVPFLTYRDQLATLRQDEIDSAIELQSAEVLLASLNGDVATLHALAELIRNFDDRYRDYDTYRALENRGRAHDADMAATRARYLEDFDENVRAWARGDIPVPDDDAIRHRREFASVFGNTCDRASGPAYAACLICQEFIPLGRQLDGAVEGLSQPGRDLLPESTEAFNTISANTCKWLNGTEPHWQERVPLPKDFYDIRRTLSQIDLREINRTHGALIQAVRSAIPGISVEITEIKRAQVVTAEQLTIYETNLNRIASFDNIGTPVGNLPIGLGQIVLLFPVMMALASMVVANSFADLMQLRAALVRLCGIRDQGGEVMDTRHVSVIAPLWLGAGGILLGQFLKWAVLAVPLLLILANLALIYKTKALTEQLPDDAAIPPGIYVVLYVLSVMMAVSALLRYRHASRAPYPER